MNRLPDMGTLRCEVLSSPKQVRELLEASGRAEQVALDVQSAGPGRSGLPSLAYRSASSPTPPTERH